MKVERLQADGTYADVTDPASGTRYESLFLNMLVPEVDGRVTCVGSFKGGPLGFDKTSVIVHFGGNRAEVSFWILPWGGRFGLKVGLSGRSELGPGTSAPVQTFLSDDPSAEVSGVGTSYLLIQGGEPPLFALDGGTIATHLRLFPGEPVFVANGPTSLRLTASVPEEAPWLSADILARRGERVGWLQVRYRNPLARSTRPSSQQAPVDHR